MDIFNKPYEPENQFLLRLPPEQAEKLKEILLAGNLRDRLTIDLQTDQRRGIVSIDGEPLDGKIVDLPCIIESLKTLDMKTFYKTSDICQMLVCSHNDENESQSNEKVLHAERRHLWPHGITPPLKNVRKRRFRKTARKKYIDSPDIEKEVKRLLKADMEAVHVLIQDYEIINEEEKQSEKSKSESSQSKEVDITDQDELHKIFQDLSSSDSDNDKDDINVDDYDEIKDFDPSEIPTGVPVIHDKQERGRLETRLDLLLSELGELRKRRQRKEILIKGENIKNEMLKMRFQSELEELTLRITETRQEYMLTLAMLGRKS